MVTLTSCPVFTALFAFGAICLYTAKIALDDHLLSEKSLSLLFGPADARDKLWHLDPLRKRTENRQITLVSSKDTVQTSRMQDEQNTNKNPHSLKFPSKCMLSENVIKYWEEVTVDSFESPLRNSSGLSEKRIENRKYLAFQPDLGGWNNIRMALEVAILFAHATGRILVLPPHAVLYLLDMNKKWGDNKASMEDFLDFDRMRAGNGLETITMKEFLATIAAPGLLSKPLPGKNTDLVRQKLWDYLESASYIRQWSPGKTFLAFNISGGERINEDFNKPVIYGTFHDVTRRRMDHITMDMARQLYPYNNFFHSQRTIYLPGHDKNRLLTLWYSYFFFAEPVVERSAKRYMRDRVRYHDVIFCAAGRVIDLLYSEIASYNYVPKNFPGIVPKKVLSMKDISKRKKEISVLPLASYKQGNDRRVYRLMLMNSSYIAYHIRRGDFQQKHTRLEAQDILDSTLSLIPGNRKKWVVYISTDETNRTFFEPFQRTFRSVRFLSDYTESAELSEMNQNHLGMLEQVVCANAHTFIGTPLSTFTSFITRMRGYMDRSVLVEVEAESSLVTLEKINLALVSKKDEAKKKPKGNTPTVVNTNIIRPDQLGRQLTMQDNEKINLVGKIFRIRSNSKIVKSYTSKDEDAFITDFLKNPYLNLQRIEKTIIDDPEALSFFGFGTISTIVQELQKLDSSRRNVAESPEILGVGMYMRTYYYMSKFTYQLHDKPYISLPLWTREFREPFEDTEEIMD